MRPPKTASTHDLSAAESLAVLDFASPDHASSMRSISWLLSFPTSMSLERWTMHQIRTHRNDSRSSRAIWKIDLRFSMEPKMIMDIQGIVLQEQRYHPMD